MIVFGVSGVVNRALSTLLLPLYTNYIPPKEYGVLTMLLIFFATIPMVLRMGLGNALLRSWYDYDEEERPKLATTVMVFLLLTSIPILLLLVFFAPQFSELIFDKSQYALHWRIVCLMVFWEIFNVVPDTLMRVRNASVRYSTCQTIGFIVRLFTIIGLVKYGRMGILGVLIGNLVGATIENSLMFIVVRRDFCFGFNRAELKTMLTFGIPLIFGRLAASCFQWIDRFFLNHYTTARVVGLYGLANQLANPITILVTTPFSMIWANMQFSTMKDKDANEYYARMLTYIVYLATVFALPVAILVEDLLRIFSPLRYWEAAMAVPWLAAAAILDAANPVLNVGINLKRKSLINPIIVISSALFNIGLNFLLIPDFGMMGATIATVLSYVFICALKYFISHHFYPIRYQWKRILQILIVGIGLFMLSQMIRVERPIISFAARLPLAIMLPFILIPLGFYDAQEWAKITELIKRIKTFFTAIAITKSSNVGN